MAKKKKKHLPFLIDLWRTQRVFFLLLGICLGIILIGMVLKIITYKRPCNYQLGEVQAGEFISKNLPCRLK